jgi:hypothetical protein
MGWLLKIFFEFCLGAVYVINGKVVIPFAKVGFINVYMSKVDVA